MAIYKNGELYKGSGVEKALTSDMEINHSISAMMQGYARNVAINEVIRRIADISKYTVSDESKMAVIQAILKEEE